MVLGVVVLGVGAEEGNSVSLRRLMSAISESISMIVGDGIGIISDDVVQPSGEYGRVSSSIGQKLSKKQKVTWDCYKTQW